MNRIFGLALVVLGIFLVFKVLFSGGVLLLLLAIALAFGAGTGAIGRWGFYLAALFGVLAIPVLLFQAVATALWLVFKLAPVLLVLVGVYLLMKAFRR